MTTSPPLLQLDHVDRLRGGRWAVRDLCLDLNSGEILGLLGVNGAGKSTTLAMLAGALRPSRGHVRMDGADLAEHPRLARRRVGWLPERVPLWPELTVDEHLRAHARLHGLHGADLRKACNEMLEELHLEPLHRRRAQALSQGQRQRLGLACAIVHRPALWILDEPGNGLDPVQNTDLRRRIRAHAAAGGGVIVSTHLLAEVTTLCSRVAIMHEGRLCHDAAVDSGAVTGQPRLRVTLGRTTDAATLTALAPVAHAEAIDPQRWSLVLAAGHDVSALVRALLQADLPLQALEPLESPLEHIFMGIATRSSAPEAA